MNLVRWTPFHDMTLLQNQMNRLFDGALEGWPSEADGTRNWVPPADIHETDNDLIVTTDLPGVDTKNIDVRVENNVLSITGERHFEPKAENDSEANRQLNRRVEVAIFANETLQEKAKQQAFTSPSGI